MPPGKCGHETGQPLCPHRFLNPAAHSRMRYFKLTIAYDGTDFHGWQFQADKPTVQGEIVSVLRRLTQETVQLQGAGRTDAGVHALGQVASFKTQSALSAAEFQRALNALLPHAIRIVTRGGRQEGRCIATAFIAAKLCRHFCGDTFCTTPSR